MLINNLIQKKVLNEFGGSEQKETVLLNNGKKYMVKFPDPIRELSKQEAISYINNVFSEYIGCHIAEMLGFSVQNTLLGEYQIGEKRKVVCLCEDVRKPGEQMRELNRISLSTDSSAYVSFYNQEKIFHHIQERAELTDAQTQELRDFYYQLFIFDALIGNTDRHNGNVAILVDANERFSRISPVYDCGSSLLPLLDDKSLLTSNINQLSLSIDSAIHDENGKRIRYNDYLTNQGSPEIDQALKKLMIKINLNQINVFIDTVPYLSEARKSFYKDMIGLRYHRILLPALQRIFSCPDISFDKNTDFYQIYKENIQEISRFPLFQPVLLQNTTGSIQFFVGKVSKSTAICFDKSKECIGILPIHSNNSAVRKCITAFYRMGIDLTKEKIFCEKTDRQMTNDKENELYERD